MLAIRMQRVGRKGHAQFRVIVQDRRFSPKSGRVVAYVGSYNPHTKQYNLDKETIAGYISKGAQPTDRVIKLLKQEGLKLPKWAKSSAPKKKAVRNPEKRRSTRPAGAPEPAPKVAEAPAAEAPAEEEKPAKGVAEQATEPATETKESEPEKPKAEEAPAEGPAAEPEKPETQAPPAEK